MTAATRRALRRGAAAWLAIAGLWGCAARPPAQETTSEPGFDSAALLADVRFLASDDLAGRRTGTEGAEAARGFVVERFRSLGLEPAYSGFLQSFRYEGEDGGASEGVNVVARIPGRDPAFASSWFVVSAHYDHLGTVGGVVYNGADDNASGIAALLAIAAELARRPLRRPVLLAALDAEESDLQGALALVREPPVPLDRIALDVNLDMVGRDDGGALWAAGARHYPWVRAPLERAAKGGPVTLRFGHDSPDEPEDWTLDSDHAAFHGAGIPFVYFGVEDHRDYHQPSDDAERIDAEFLANAATLVLRALRELDESAPRPSAAGAS